jgi:phosphoribosylamine--glycine ligase
VEEQIIKPTLAGMADDGRAYSGCLYVGIMLTSEGPKVVEFNARFGDPETQVVLPLYHGDLCELLLASALGTLVSPQTPRAISKHAVCVVLSSRGYPDAYEAGIPIEGLGTAGAMDGVVVFHAGTRVDRSQILTSGGRVLGVTALTSGTLREAIGRAYEAVEKIRFEGMHYRKDIGQKALFTNL